MIFKRAKQSKHRNPWDGPPAVPFWRDRSYLVVGLFVVIIACAPGLHAIDNPITLIIYGVGAYRIAQWIVERWSE